MSYEERFPPREEAAKLHTAVLRRLLAGADWQSSDEHEADHEVARAAQAYVRAVNLLSDDQEGARPYWWEMEEPEALRAENTELKAQVKWLRRSVEYWIRCFDVFHEHTNEFPLTEERRARLKEAMGDEMDHTLVSITGLGEELGKLAKMFTVANSEPAPPAEVVRAVMEDLGAVFDMPDSFTEAYRRGSGVAEGDS